MHTPSPNSSQIPASTLPQRYPVPLHPYSLLITYRSYTQPYPYTYTLPALFACTYLPVYVHTYLYIHPCLYHVYHCLPSHSPYPSPYLYCRIQPLPVCEGNLEAGWYLWWRRCLHPNLGPNLAPTATTTPGQDCPDSAAVGAQKGRRLGGGTQILGLGAGAGLWLEQH